MVIFFHFFHKEMTEKYIPKSINTEILGIFPNEEDKLVGYPHYSQFFEVSEKCEKPMNLISQFYGEENIPYQSSPSCYRYIYQCSDHKDMFSHVEGY